MSSKSNIEKLTFELISLIGENPKRNGLLKTPKRVSESWGFLTKGYNEDLKNIINGAVFTEKYDEMVIVKDIEFYSMCEHHLLPFLEKCTLHIFQTEK